MKQLALLMALVGLTATGCVQNKVFGPLARKGTNQNISAELNSAQRGGGDNIQLTAFGGGCDDTCCGGDCCCECPDGCCGGDDCCGQCCGDGCCGDSSSGCGLFGRKKKNKNNGCSSCDNGRCGPGSRMCGAMAGCNPHAGGYPEAQNFNPGPQSGQVAYPYYTVRGPRDFLRNNPPSIGPY